MPETESLEPLFRGAHKTHFPSGVPAGCCSEGRPSSQAVGAVSRALSPS